MGINFNAAADAFKAVASSDDALDAVLKVAAESAGKISEGKETQLQENELGAFVINKRLDKANAAERNPPIPKKDKAAAGERIKPPQDIKELAEGFQGKHPQLKGFLALENLKALPGRIQGAKTAKEIIEIVTKSYPNDSALASDIFDFLEEATVGDLKNLVHEAKLSFVQQRQGDVSSAREVSNKQQELEEKGVPATKIDEMTTSEGDAKNSISVFEDFLKKYRSVKDIKVNASSLLHIIGEIPKEQRTGIESANLINNHKLLHAVQDTIALLNQMDKVGKNFEKQASMQEIDSQPLYTETLAKSLMNIIADPRISPEKVLYHARNVLGTGG